MKHLFFGRRATVVIPTVILSLGITSASAQAATVSSPHVSAAASTMVKASASQDSSTPQVCVFQDNEEGGNFACFPTATWSGRWVNLVTPAPGEPSGLTLPWGSFIDDSGSSVVFGDAQTGQTECFAEDSVGIGLKSTIGNDRYMWIEFGNTSCTGKVGKLP
jgi:hypothetical protein